ncbi:ferredoxin [Gottschalkia purinilytica]|uniref:Ferredoxin n=1 Tax=Gottschalkia purinilytica TaxID=1503 RepID=A0A0L0WA17_GOTPU|nr:ASKHA domain-containing protein [Gottschalkia purinilytica]KNF08393.1 ferredoxin [Gottschalkia purinilytica]
MVKVHIKNLDKVIEVPKNTLLIDAIRKGNVDFETPCNGAGTCGKCKVKVKGNLSAPLDEEKSLIKNEENIRLACQASIQGDIEVTLLKFNSNDLKTINKGYSIDTKLESRFKKINLPKYDQSNSTPYIESLNYDIKNLKIYSKLSYLLDHKINSLEGIVFDNTILDIDKSFNNLLGVAIDIGTTGISSYLVDIQSGEIINKISSLNPQSKFGGDVLSRITYSMTNKNGLKELHESIINEINLLVNSLLENKYSNDDIYNVVISANTTMLHFLLGVSAISISRAPYKPIFLDKIDINAEELGININSLGIVTLLPSASGYVGSDIVSGVVATGFDNKENTAVFVDIGTNGEIVLISNSILSGTSTAAGPALEGMNISCGSRAESGAIETFNIDDNFNFNIGVIGNIKAKSICGSGLIDIMSELIDKKVVLKSGRFNKNMPQPLLERLVDKNFYITDDIYISQSDIRQVQLAKGAISTGILLLLKQFGMTIDDVDEVVVAGAFGYHLNPESIKKISLIPKGFKGTITFVGNSSIEGARLSLINKDILDKMSYIKENIKVLELSMSDEFQETFIKELSF